MSELAGEAHALLATAREAYRDNPRAAGWLARAADALAGPLRVAVAGRPRAGKSTLVNALIGEQVAPVGLAAPVWYVAGATPRVTVYPRGGAPVEVQADRHGGGLLVDLEQWQDQPVDRVVVSWPARTLRGLALVDMPAEPSTMDSYDAVLHLAPQVQSADLRLLAELPPVATLLVAARADEVGGSRLDALPTARQLAGQHRHDPRVRGLCQDVLAVSGLLAAAGRTLREDDFAALAGLSHASRADTDRSLLSADRFAGNDPVRRALLDRLGLFGVRLSCALIRQGFDSHAALCAELTRRSGLAELRDALGRHFLDRAEVLKARSALHAVEVVTRAESGAASAAVARDVDRILAGAHDLRELRLLATLRTGHPALPGELAVEAHRLLGGVGLTPQARFDLDDPAELPAALHDTLRRWHELAVNPVLDHAARTAAATVVRSCEALLGAR